MATFKVNGRTVQTEKNQKLLRFLRDELHLTSVKDGCSEGACGACTVIIDGKTCKACVPDTDLLEGREVITVEGLTEWEEQVYTYAYGKADHIFLILPVYFLQYIQPSLLPVQCDSHRPTL